MKKILAFAMATAMALSIAACGGGSNPPRLQQPSCLQQSPRRLRQSGRQLR